MTQSEFEQNIGRKVISASFGEGIISEITEMNNEPFYIVLNQSNNMRHYVPINVVHIDIFLTKINFWKQSTNL